MEQASGVAVALVLAWLAGAVVYCTLVVVAAARYRAARPAGAGRLEGISILKPLSGLDDGLEQNLASWFEQDYPEFELLFGVRRADDPALEVVEKLRCRYPGVPARVVVTGEPPYPNAKVFSLACMLGQARHSLLLMSDSDTRAATSRMLRIVAAEFQDERLGLATCPYRAVPGASLWSGLEAIGMNTEFLAGILVARMLEGMRFGVGPTMAARREALEAIGGFDRLKDYLAEDFVMGREIAAAGYHTILSSGVIEHRIGAQPWGANAAHRLRWARSTRRSRPAGYVGQGFTYPLVPALLLAVLQPAWWPVTAAGTLARTAAAWATAGWVLKDSYTGRRWWLLPFQDFLSFGFWLAGFFGTTVSWRGRRYRIYADGRFAPVGGSDRIG